MKTPFPSKRAQMDLLHYRAGQAFAQHDALRDASKEAGELADGLTINSKAYRKVRDLSWSLWKRADQCYAEYRRMYERVTLHEWLDIRDSGWKGDKGRQCLDNALYGLGGLMEEW